MEESSYWSEANVGHTLETADLDLVKVVLAMDHNSIRLEQQPKNSMMNSIGEMALFVCPKVQKDGVHGRMASLDLLQSMLLAWWPERSPGDCGACR